MKVVLFLLALLPLALCAPSDVDKRWLIDVNHVIDEIKHLITPEMGISGCTTVCEGAISGIGTLVCPSACTTLISSLHLDGK